MFTRFTTGARQAVVGAQESARELGHDHVGTDHLLLGTIDAIAGSELARSLDRRGLTRQKVREAAVSTRGAGEGAAPERIPFEPSTKQALELALREALKLGDEAITPEHLLLGIHAQEASPGAQLLRAAEPSRDKLCDAIAGGRASLRYSPQFLPNASFKVVLLDGDAEAWEGQLNDAAALGYDLVEIVDRRAILRRV